MSSPARARPSPASVALVGTLFGLLVVAAVLATLGVFGVVASGVLIAGAAAWGFWAAGRARTMVVSEFDPRFAGALIAGRGLALLGDIIGRFDYAGRMVGQVPTGIVWAEVQPSVDVLVWSAAEHAARISSLDAEAHEMRYAAAGTPQAAFRSTIMDRRAEHEAALLDIQREAEDLARHAGNAAAAARMALQATGDLRSLEVVAPTGRELRARDALADAKARLEMLASVWSDLDPTSAMAAETLRAASPPVGEGRQPPVA